MLDPLPSADWTPEAAAHLLNRAGFGGTPEEIFKLHQLGHDRAVDELLSGDEDADLFPPPRASVPLDVVDLRMQASQLTEQQKTDKLRELRRTTRELMVELRAWWLNRMRWTTYPAREKALLFWHGHWATSVEKVREPYLMWQQNDTLRACALGSFRTMASDISRDPAMMRYLDVQQSNKAKPNENFAREVMELFTLGEGQYTEQDIREASRAFTGYRIDPHTRQFHYAKHQHDDGQKTFFGKTGPFTGDDILAIILDDPQAAFFLSRKLWAYYAGVPAPDGVQDALAAEYRAVDYDNKKLLRLLFRSREFYSKDVVRAQIKSPVQWLVSTCRMLDLPLPDAYACDGILRQLGQMPFEPPNVKGWDGGRAWISSATLLLRYNIAGYLISGKAPGLPGVGKERINTLRISVDKVFAGATTPQDVCRLAEWRLFQCALPPAAQQKFTDYIATHGTKPEARRDLLHLMMSTPEFQLT